MSDAHDYPTRQVRGRDITSADVLVGESGGLCAVYGVNESVTFPNFMVADTEFGPLYLYRNNYYSVYDEQPMTKDEWNAYLDTVP